MSAAVDAFVGGATVAARRLLRPATVLVASVALGVSATSGLVERGASALEAPDRALGVVLGLVVPLTTFALGSLAMARQRLGDATWPIARWGAPRAQVALGMMAVTAAMAAVVAAASSTVSLIVAYGALPGLGADVAVSAWVAALGATAYLGWFSLGGSFLRRGRGRWLVLVLDFTLGGATSALGLVWPRAHLASLAGGEAVMDIGQPQSSVMLLALVAVTAILAAMRAGR